MEVNKMVIGYNLKKVAKAHKNYNPQKNWEKLYYEQHPYAVKEAGCKYCDGDGKTHRHKKRC
jgi:hypothetical protein